MRRWLTILGGAVLFIATATPAEASWEYFPFAVSPPGGPTGTSISVRGDCQESQPGVATLKFAGTDQNLDIEFFGAGPFNVSLTNRAGVDPNGFPVELEVEVECFGLRDRPQPFSSTARTASSRSPLIATTTSSGRAHLKGFDETGAMASLNRYILDWGGGASVAMGYLGSSSPGIVVASGPGRRGELAIFSPEPAAHVFPMGDFAGGLNVALGDVNGDRRDDLIVAAGVGGGPHVRVLTLEGIELGSFYAYDPSFRGGVNIAAADVDGDGRDEIITGTGPGGGPHVKVFKSGGTVIASFMAYDPAFRGGVNVSGADLDGSRGAEIVTAPGPGGGPHVRLFNLAGQALGAGFFAYDPAFAGGVSVAAGDVNGFGHRQIVTAPWSGGAPHVRVFDANGASTSPGFYAYGNTIAGVRVAVTNR